MKSYFNSRTRNTTVFLLLDTFTNEATLKVLLTKMGRDVTDFRFTF